MRDDIIEACARAMASALGDDFDHAHVNKSEWITTRGEKGGRFRDVNEPRKDDYLDAARAVLATFKAMTADPTPGMIEAADGIDDESGTAQSGGAHWSFMHEAMWKEIGI